MLRKAAYVTEGMVDLVREHRLYFLAPILFFMALLSVLCYYVGPQIIITFIYAGV